MANHTGNEGTIKVGANAVAEVTDWEINQEGATVNDTVIGDTWESNKPLNCSKWAGSLTCFWDETDTNGQGALEPGDEVTLNLYPEGATAGDTYFTGSAIVTSNKIGAARDGMVSNEISFLGNGAPTKTTV